jgi:hypothetical protein
MEEQFIQDAISKPARVLRLLEHLGYKWQFEDSDVLNQEFNFSAIDPSSRTEVGGRIDVIATFNGRTRLAIIETKSVANPEDLKQLTWYLEHCAAIGAAPSSGLSSIDFGQTVGILLANDFAPGLYETPERMHCVRFRFQRSEFPFVKHVEVPPGATEEPPTAVFKQSRLVTIQDHRGYLCESLQPAFDELRRLCLREGDQRSEWLIENPKGQYLAYFFVRKTSFDFGYTLHTGENIRLRVGAGGMEASQVITQARLHLAMILDGIDRHDKSRGIPEEFSWRDFDNPMQPQPAG